MGSINGTNRQNRTMDGKHILVVDDEKNMIRTLEFIFHAQNYRVTTATNGQMALEKIVVAKEDGNPIHLLITKLLLPGLTGAQLIDKLNRLKVKMPVFMIGGYRNWARVIGLAHNGNMDYLNEPFDEEEFVRRVGLLFKDNGGLDYGSCPRQSNGYYQGLDGEV